jgi:3-hydroxybutyryl-CoA dehydratase
MPRHLLPTLGFEDLCVDDEWESLGRTITEADVVNFAGVSGDFNPLHIDREAARSGFFHKPVAHGLLGLAVATGLASQAPRLEVLAFLGILEWRFLGPIGFGDTIRVISRVVALEPRSKGRRGVVTWHRRLVNQNGETVQEGRTQALVRARSHRQADELADPTP